MTESSDPPVRWTIEERERVLPGQSVLSTRLDDGRRIVLDAVHVGLSAEGWMAGKPDRIWDSVVNNAPRRMNAAWGHPPAYMIAPASLQPDIPVLPRWLVHALLRSEAIGPDADGSKLVIVFFCDDISSRPISDLVGQHIASLQETLWRKCARDFRF